MIWGSQYDAMLNFALIGNDKSKIDSADYGNYTGSILKTGLTRTSDKINNIYDLGGNLREWTSEAYDTRYRVTRGGCCSTALSPALRRDGNATGSSSAFSLRFSLYVEQVA